MFDPTVAHNTERILGHHNFADFAPRKKMSPKEYDAYCAQAFAFWHLLEHDLRKMMFDQLVETARADSWEKANFGKGVLQGFETVFSYYESLANKHTSGNPSGDVVRPDPFPEIPDMNTKVVD